MSIRQEYPLHLKRRDKIFVEGKPHIVHSATFHQDDRWGPLHNKVSVETTTGCMLMLPIAHAVEVHR